MVFNEEKQSFNDVLISSSRTFDVSGRRKSGPGLALKSPLQRRGDGRCQPCSLNAGSVIRSDRMELPDILIENYLSPFFIEVEVISAIYFPPLLESQISHPL